jgi:ketosteroid isomerase-like protein
MTAPLISSDVDPLGVAARWRHAVESNDMATLRSLYHPDAKIWTNLERRTHELEEHICRIAEARARSDGWEYHDVRCQRTDSGFVSEHTVRVKAGGIGFESVAAVIGTLRDGRIVHLSEYLHKPRRADPD